MMSPRHGVSNSPRFDRSSLRSPPLQRGKPDRYDNFNVPEPRYPEEKSTGKAGTKYIQIVKQDANLLHSIKYVEDKKETLTSEDIEKWVKIATMQLSLTADRTLRIT